jgi:hypothetical protein
MRRVVLELHGRLTRKNRDAIDLYKEWVSQSLLNIIQLVAGQQERCRRGAKTF